MCGIVGIHGKQDQTWIESINRIQFHRGPDDAGIFRDESLELALASSRLAIIDVAHGKQPMSTADGMCTIVFNGEIFNAPSLRRDLENQGEVFLTDHSDTEVVLRLYEREGEGMLPKLNGMFAFCIFDFRKKELFLARDHAGIKPLHYGFLDGRFCFASEIKSILALPFCRRELHPASFSHYVSCGYIPGNETIYKGIFRLPPASFLRYSLGKKTHEITPWFSLHIGSTKKESLASLSHRVREGLTEAVARWSLSDVPIAASLSGGLDSSSIVALLTTSGVKVKTVSLGFSNRGEEEYDELAQARAVAAYFGTDHREIVLPAEKLLDDLLEMVWHLDEPYGGGLPSWYVCKEMAREVKVALTGSGGDELFGNYGKWQFLERGAIPFTRRGVRRVGAHIFEKEFFNRYYYFSNEEKRKYLDLSVTSGAPKTSDLLFGIFRWSGSQESRDGIAYLDFTTQLPEEFLLMTDRFSMAHSLEARTPFLDIDFVKLVYSIPARIRTRRGELKYLLRRAVGDLLPDEIRAAPKKGFILPLELWLRTTLRPLVEFLLAPSRLKKQGLVSPTFYTDCVVPHLDGKADFTHKIWTMVMFQLWYELFIIRHAQSRPTYSWKDLIA